MKRTAITFDLSYIRKFAQRLTMTGKLFGAMAGATAMLFVLFGAAGYAQSNLHVTPGSTMKGLASSISTDFFMDMMGLEVPRLSANRPLSLLSQHNVLSFAFRLLTDINPHDPRSLLAREVPGLGKDDPILLVKGGGTDGSLAPQDYTPAKNAQDDPQPPAPQTPSAVAAASPSPSASPTPTPAPEPTPDKMTTNGRKVVMIYHSHNRESFLPELKTKDPNKAYDKEKNITLVGKRMAEKLNELGVGSVDYSTDYTSAVKNFNYTYSYKYSQKTVKEAFASNPDIRFLFDLHRDSLGRDKTTAAIGGKNYAQVLFIIGQKNPNWEKNEQFASQLQGKLEKLLPGISRGIWGKNAHEGNAEYNQSLSPHNILIEIGGPYNSLEECYRTADVMAQAIADLYWDAEKVDGPVTAKK